MPRDMLPPAAPTLEGLIEWLKTKDPNEEYLYTDGERCMVFQFLQHLGYDVVSVNPTHYKLRSDRLDAKPTRYPYVLNVAAQAGYGRRAGTDDWITFGAALEYAIKLAAIARKMEIAL